MDFICDNVSDKPSSSQMYKVMTKMNDSWTLGIYVVPKGKKLGTKVKYL